MQSWSNLKQEYFVWGGEDFHTCTLDSVSIANINYTNTNVCSRDLGCCHGDGLSGDCRCLLVAQSVLPNARVGKASPLPHFTSKSTLATVPQPASLFQQQNDFVKDSWGVTWSVLPDRSIPARSPIIMGLRYVNTMFYIYNVRKELKRNKMSDADIRYSSLLWGQLRPPLFIFLKYYSWAKCCVSCGNFVSRSLIRFHIKWQKSRILCLYH